MQTEMFLGEEAPARPATEIFTEQSCFYSSPAETRKQASQAASQLPTPTASGSVDNSFAGALQSTQSEKFGCWVCSDNVEAFLSFDFVPGCFACSCTLGVSFSFFFGGGDGGCLL